MLRLRVSHKTTYRYVEPVEFGDHRLMLRPRDSHDLRLLSATITIEPHAHLRWFHDVFGNSVAIASFTEHGSQLMILSEIVLDRYPLSNIEVAIEPYATKLPFSYSAIEIPDLGRTIERHYPDPDRHVTEWTRLVLERPGVDGRTEAFLRELTSTIQRDFSYLVRHEPGVQSPLETLQTGCGSCRDYALLMMEAVRSVGLAARFVSGYLYDPAVDGGDFNVVGAGATHAWVQVYLPGAGWVEFDPTNGGSGGQNLVPIAVARVPSQAIPIAGTFTCQTQNQSEIEVEVTVRSVSPENPLDQ